LHCCVGWLNFECAFILRDRFTHALQFAQSVATAYSHSKVHLFKTFSVSAFRIKAVFEVLYQANRFITLLYHAVKFILCEQACDLVDVDSDIVQSCGFSSYAKSLLVKLESWRKISLLQKLVGLVLVLGESELVKLLLYELE